ncbi:Mitotic-spindle organizing protein 1 [Galdieria sulphuraria]|nr:Mitotic-spindle organizing protein 1 [Galdieria sulphuraria]
MISNRDTNGMPFAKETLEQQQAVEKKNEILEMSYEIAKLLETGLDRETLQVAIELLEQGFDPYALASVLRTQTRKQPNN